MPARFICGSARDLEVEVKQGGFARICTTGSAECVCDCPHYASEKKTSRY